MMKKTHGNILILLFLIQSIYCYTLDVDKSLFFIYYYYSNTFDTVPPYLLSYI